MRRDDALAVVLRLRERREQEHLVARAAAERAAADARARVAALTTELATRAPTAGTRLDPDGLTATRVASLALGEQLQRSRTDVTTADRRRQRAESARAEAAVARRSVEKLQERRERQARVLADRRRIRREDELGLESWRRAR